MRFNQVRNLAREMGIRARRTTTKTELIRTIQREEGNFDCFASASAGECDQMDCVWRVDCFLASKGRN